ncbi:hypothetical protein H5410_057519 [Solanum commersonii]|uniref:Uncharacterized protein n=1 Tax=Solanum commersonii TaxID=4109 RepID=A0A9J5WNB1_SOLCO|nr:hypothetical protein H5410_057519 [Solanum commersonii]
MSDKRIDLSPGSPARARIAKDFQRSKWKLFRKWFFKNFNKEEQYVFQEEFYKDIIDSGINRLVAFVPWFMCKHVHNYVSMLERDFTLSNGEITKLVFPPLQSFQISKNDKIVNFNAFSKLFENGVALVTIQHVNAMIKQNNYANIYMSILGDHIISLHDKVDKIISSLPTKTKGKEKVAHNLENFLEKKFKGGGIQPINVENLLEGEPSHNNEFSDDINKISERYARKLVQRMHYYPRPTPQNVLLEEHEHIITNSYNGKEIYEWNINGCTDRQIYTTVHRMLMYSTICKTNKNSDKTIVDMITVGFTVQLKGWWDNYLNQDQRDKILQAVKLEGEWSDNSETIRTLLQNLRCKTTSFRYYKDVFLCKVMELPECNNTHWKSKFIDGLPTLYAERVRKAIRGENHSINYDDYTYGKLVSARLLVYRKDFPYVMKLS